MVHKLSCSLASGIFLDQGLNPCPLHWQEDSYPLHHQEGPLTVVLICILLMLSDIEHLFRCLFAILISSLLKLPFKCLAYIFICPYCLFFLVERVLPIFGYNPLLCIYLANIFPPVCSLFFKIFLEYLLKRHFISKVF